MAGKIRHIDHWVIEIVIFGAFALVNMILIAVLKGKYITLKLKNRHEINSAYH